MKTKHFRDFSNSFLIIQKKERASKISLILAQASSSLRALSQGKTRAHRHLTSRGAAPLLNRDLDQLL